MSTNTPALSSSLQSRLETAKPSTGRGAIIMTVGMEGSGKTGWALSAAVGAFSKSLGRTVYIGMDRKPVGEHINALLRDNGILKPKLSFAGLKDKSHCEKNWTELKSIVMDILKDPGCGPLILDTGTFGWELLRMARFGKLNQVLPHHYGPVNTEFESIFYAAEEYGKIVIVIHKMGREYKTGKDGKDSWTGRYERKGYSSMGFVANVALEHYRTESNGFGVRVLQNKITPATDGEEMEDELCNFGVFAWKTFGEPAGEDLEEYVG